MTHDLATDIWSVGVLLHILLSGLIPFTVINGLQNRETISNNIIKGKLHLSHVSFQRVSNDAKDLLIRMIEVNDLHRITAILAL